MCLRKEPLADGIGLRERDVRPAAVGKRIDWGLVALCESRRNIQYAIQPCGWERFVRVVLIQKKVPIGSVVEVVLKMRAAG